MRHVRGCWLLLATLIATNALGAEPAQIKIRIENNYVAVLDFGFLGNGARGGKDIAEGTLTLQSDNSWKGVIDASVAMSQQLKGLGLTCPMTRYTGTQQLNVLAKTVGGFADTQTITHRSGTRGGGFLALDFTPASDPSVSPTPTEGCLDLPHRDGNIVPYLPLNDARWTLKHARYVVELPVSGTLSYDDGTVELYSENSGDWISNLPVQAYSNWKIRVEKL